MNMKYWIKIITVVFGYLLWVKLVAIIFLTFGVPLSISPILTCPVLLWLLSKANNNDNKLCKWLHK